MTLHLALLVPRAELRHPAKKTLKPKSRSHTSALTAFPSSPVGFPVALKTASWPDGGQTTERDGSSAVTAYSMIEVTQIYCIPFLCPNHKTPFFPLRWLSSCAYCPTRLVLFLSRLLQANAVQKSLAAIHTKPLPGCEIDEAGFKTCCEMKQYKKLTTIILLNVAAYLPKDFGTAD